MGQRLPHCVLGLALLPLLALLAACAWPTRDEDTIRAIRAESLELMATKPTRAFETAPKGGWPPAIASLDPDSVSVDTDEVYILIKPSFDGGWGYYVPRDEKDVPQPGGPFTALGHGVYWYRPL